MLLRYKKASQSHRVEEILYEIISCELLIQPYKIAITSSERNISKMFRNQA